LKEKLLNAKLYLLLSNISDKKLILEKAKLALDGGADIIQLREKSISDKDYILIARDLQTLASETNAIFIVNDRVNIARDINADGIHIGQDDMEPDKVKEIIGPEKIIGVSTHNIDQALAALKSQADYIGIGPVFPTKTKSYEPVAGLGFVNRVVKTFMLNNDTLNKTPVFAIGGITLSNIDQVLQTGISRVAVSSAIIDSDDIAGTTKEFKSILK